MGRGRRHCCREQGGGVTKTTQLHSAPSPRAHKPGNRLRDKALGHEVHQWGTGPVTSAWWTANR